jgi:hypothetical protein
MSTVEIKARIHELVDSLDDSLLNVVHSMLYTYVEQKGVVSQEDQKILDKRILLHEQDPTSGTEWSALKSELLN